MGYIEFDKSKLINLEYSLQKELLRSNRAGAYASTTIVGCNTRKYHGLLIVQQPAIDSGFHVLLSSFDISVIQRGTEFNLGIRKYGGNNFSPKGHKYIRDFESDPIPKLTYRVGGVVLTTERLFVWKDDRMLVRLTLEDAHSPTTLRIKPFLAFRSRHSLSKKNDRADTEAHPVVNGIRIRMYPEYSDLYLQLSGKAGYQQQPEWYYGVEYPKEHERGYDYREDLFAPGFFEFPMKKGQRIIFSAGIESVVPENLQELFFEEERHRIPRDSFEHCLENAAQQFINTKGERTDIIAGYPWLGSSGRDTFIALPGLFLASRDLLDFENVIDTLVKEMKDGFFPAKQEGKQVSYESSDTSLWFVYALQKYVELTGRAGHVWQKYGPVIKEILHGYRKGTSYGIGMSESGLIRAGDGDTALTWMNVRIGGKPLTPRNGMAVEINALWINAIRFSLYLADLEGDQEFIQEWNEIAGRTEKAFIDQFWDEEKGYLADVVQDNGKDWSVRPNMIIAASLPFTPLTDEMTGRLLSVAEKELLTSRGLRSLSPKNPDYHGVYHGNQTERDRAYHQGTVFPWLLGHFAEAYLRIHGKSGVSFIERLYEGFEEEMTNHGIGTVSEVYDGDPPHSGRGSVSQAWNVAELLRIRKMLNDYDK